ncbi:BTAD domain-containing putative transcriptional regulator [Planomonospora algeriensis]
MRFNLLGPLQIRDGERIIKVTAPRQRAVLAVLALEAGRPVAVERLMEVLSDKRDIKPGVIRVYIKALRELLPDGLIENDPGNYVLAVEPRQVDVWWFHELVKDAHRTSPSDAAATARTLESALALWRGRALADVPSEHLRLTEAEPLEEKAVIAREDLCEARLRLGEHRQVIGDLRRLVARHPLREYGYELLMTALYRSGNQGEALALFQTLHRTLDAELGVLPSAESRRVHDRILAADPSLNAPDRPPFTPPDELPPDDPGFTGRRAELDWVDDVLPSRRATPLHLVIHGQVGVGKSALAVHAAWRHRSLFPDGRLFADLRGRPAPETVLAGFLRSLGYADSAVPTTPEARRAAYRTLTSGRRLLVLLDNAADESQVRELLPTGPGSVTLITSRSSLAGLTGAHRRELDVLDADEARELLGGLIGPARLGADEDAARHVLESCGGLPLALRVTGARISVNRDPSAGPVARLLRDGRARLDRMRAGDTAVRTVLALGYDGLDDGRRTLLRRLAALSAPSVADWVTAPLTGAPGLDGGAEAVAEAGLLQRLSADEAGQHRFRLHELTRLFARERLIAEEGADAPRRVLAGLAPGVLGLVRMAVLPLTSEGFEDRDLPPALPAGTTEIRHSIEWLAAEHAFLIHLVEDLAGAGLHGPAWRLAHALTAFLEDRHHLDGWRIVSRTALASARADGDGRGEGLVLRDLGDLRRAEHRLEDAAGAFQSSLGHLVRHGDTRDRARVLHRLGRVRLEQGRLPEAGRHLSQGLVDFRSRSETRGEALCLRDLGVVRHRAGDLPGALEDLSRALHLLRASGDRHGQASCLHELVLVQLDRGEPDRAARHALEEADLAGRRLRDPRRKACALLSTALAGHAAGDPEAASHAGEAAARMRDLGDRYGQACALTAVATITGLPGEARLAHSLFTELGDRHSQMRALLALAGTVPGGEAEEAREAARRLAAECGFGLAGT